MFITDTSCISPQKSNEENFFGRDINYFEGTKYFAVEPDYMGLIRPGALRRMGKAVRMGIGTGNVILQRNQKPDGIIIGTADGALEDCFKFLNQIVSFNEGTLTPTHFVQSTPNAVAGQLAQVNANTGYNITHVHKGLAFENSLIDAGLLFAENAADALLVGNVEEISNYNYNIDDLAETYKKEPVHSETILSTDTEGSVCGEGAAMFYMQKEAENYQARIIDVNQITSFEETDVIKTAQNLFDKNSISYEDIDMLVMGYSGDNRTDHLYDRIAGLFPKAGICTYKNLVGDYPTVSAFATWLSVQILKGEEIPDFIIKKKPLQEVKKILVYNHYIGMQHGFVLMSK